jgi:predicted ATPase/tetratricopeptide (TPR) repeat protein
MAADWPAEILGQDEASEVLAEDGTPVLRGLRVRMGAHAGTPICQPDPNTGRMDYFGGMVNRAARVGGAGHGGQILVSSSTWHEINGQADGAEVIDLGEHALKGLERREHLRQILPALLAGRSFPRIKTPNLKKTNLPARLDSFFGRELEIEGLEKRVADGQRLITLLGAGGTGKTRLSQRFGGKMLAQFPGGVWFADLSEARSLSGIISAMGTALDVPLIQKAPEAQLANAILGRGRVLIILDNFEQVVEHGAETIGRWLQRAPEAVFLVSSRILLSIEGEEVLYLDPLPVAEAVNLFYDRGRAVQPNFERSADNEPIVTDICERLDCMSLAIELAAARVRMLAPEQIGQRLSQRFKLLRGQRRDLSDRQATLRGAIDWSWELLKPHEQSALAQLAIFRGGCTLEAAEAVIGLEDFEDEPWVMDTVEALVDHSLLRRNEPIEGHIRYRMLESVREYATEKLGDGAAAVALRQAQYFATFGSQEFTDSLDRHGGVQRRQELVLKIDNLIASVDGALAANEWELAACCAFAAVTTFDMKCACLDGIAMLNRLPAERLKPSLQARLLLENGAMLLVAGRLTEASTALEQALAIAREVGSRTLEGGVFETLGSLHHYQGKLAKALTHFEQGLAIAREANDRRVEGRILSKLGSLHKQQGRPAEALTHYEQGLALASEVGDRRSEGRTLSNLGVLHQEQGRLAEALTHYEQGIAIAREVGDPRIEGAVISNLGTVYNEQGRIAMVLTYFEQAIAIAREMGDRGFEGIVVGNLGEVLYNSGELLDAEKHLQQAIEILDEISSPNASTFRGTIAQIHAENGVFDKARALLDEADLQLRGVHAHELAKLLCKRARIEQSAGDFAAATRALTEAESIAEEIKPGPDSDLGQEVIKARKALNS